MRIGVNALFLQRPQTGMGQHLFHLLQGLDENDSHNTYILLSPRFRHTSVGRFPQLSERFRNIEVMSALRRFGQPFEALWWEQVGMVRACHKESVDLLHCPYFAAPYFLPGSNRCDRARRDPSRDARRTAHVPVAGCTRASSPSQCGARMPSSPCRNTPNATSCEHCASQKRVSM